MVVLYKAFDWPDQMIYHISSMKIDIPQVKSQVSSDSKMVQQITFSQIVCIISTSIIFFILLVTPMTVFSILNHIEMKNLELDHSNSKFRLMDIEVSANGCNLRKDCGKSDE